MSYNTEAILAVADAITVAQYLGIEMVTKGGRTFIRCPGHFKTIGRTDNNINNCILDSKGYHCFACGDHGDVITLVQNYIDCTFLEAVKIVTNLYGGSQSFKNKEKLRLNILSSADLSLIGLNPVHNPEVSDAGRLVYNTSIVKQAETDVTNCAHKHREYVVYRKTARPSLQELYDTDRRSYYALIERKAKEAAYKYKQALADYGSIRGKKAKEIMDVFQTSPEVTNDIFKGIRNELKRKQNRAWEIHNEYRKLKESTF